MILLISFTAIKNQLIIIHCIIIDNDTIFRFFFILLIMQILINQHNYYHIHLNIIYLEFDHTISLAHIY